MPRRIYQGPTVFPQELFIATWVGLDRDWDVVIVDDGGVSASETAFMLAGEGFGKVSVLTDGFPAWQGATEQGMDDWHDKLKPK